MNRGRLPSGFTLKGFVKDEEGHLKECPLDPAVDGFKVDHNSHVGELPVHEAMNYGGCPPTISRSPLMRQLCAAYEGRPFDVDPYRSPLST